MGKSDPRVVRTKQLILDAFTDLIQEKDFKNITVRDITEKATINRATFYMHFTDKYDLLDSTLLEGFRENLKKRLYCHELLNKRSLGNLLLVMCQYHQELSEGCRRNYQSLGEHFQSKMIEELQNVILHLLENKHHGKEEYQSIATALSWGIYGAAYNWNKDGRKIPAEQLVEQLVPVLENGLRDYYKETV
ncbi:TetR/AcrR family transcriptional regulator [Cytobacillus sp. Hz8]|uniref:TetR/AcrR family transcriptional regulator n=1 Tax=Cytobacillus sp. Hz8 TaxID=3347168 RepID=UPI0035D7ABAA